MSFFTLKLVHGNVFLWFCEVLEKFGSSIWLKVLSTNQNAGFFDHQYLWKESSSVIVFLHGVSHQWKVPYETTTFALVRPIVPLMQLNSRIFLSSTFLEMSVDILVFLHGGNHQEKVASEANIYRWVGQFRLLFNQIVRFFY